MMDDLSDTHREVEDADAAVDVVNRDGTFDTTNAQCANLQRSHPHAAIHFSDMDAGNATTVEIEARIDPTSIEGKCTILRATSTGLACWSHSQPSKHFSDMYAGNAMVVATTPRIDPTRTEGKCTILCATSVAVRNRALAERLSFEGLTPPNVSLPTPLLFVGEDFGEASKSCFGIRG
mmetsp:Transcript_18289/g.33981  ORF Transcript_18289/g.33981 Transcript_18289/m.33981 type:complete len:178 (-) Transcript_18289:1526-2059(-)